jgi:hypothetical protein
MNITRRKAARRDVRQALGTSRDPAPGTMELLHAATHLAEALRLTSGRYRLVVMDGGDIIEAREALSRESEAREAARRAREAGA